MFALFVITTTVFLLAFVNLWLWTRRQLRQPASSFQTFSTDTQLASEVSALKAGALGLGERLLKIERDLKTVKERLEQIEIHSAGESSYAQAINLARRGVSPEDLMQICDLSQNEAELLIMLHKENSATANNTNAKQTH